MIVLIKSGPGTTEGRRGIKLARDMAADIVLLQDGVYFVLNDLLGGFCGTAYSIKEDMDLRGLIGADIPKDLKGIGWDELTDMMAGEDKVVGVF